MAYVNTAKVTIKIRHDTAENWRNKNPILLIGEYGYEENTFLLKIGDGITPWNNLQYLNKIDNSYFEKQEDGEITFSQSFKDLIEEIAAKQNVTEKLIITNNPINPTDATNKRYVDSAIKAAGHLKKVIINNLSEVTEPDEDTIYLLKEGNYYHEYYVINNTLTCIGGITNLVPATSTVLGGVLSSEKNNFVKVTTSGFMTLNKVSTSLLYVPEGDTLVINGGKSLN